MSVAYQSWEVASGPTMGYNMAIQSKSNICSILDTLPPDASSYNGSPLGMLSSSESFLKAVVGGSDMSNGLILPSPKVLMPQDNVTRGFSSLSLHSLQELEATTSKNLDLKWLSTSNETTLHNSASQSAEYQMQARAPGFSSLGRVGVENICKPLSPLLTMLPMTSFPDGCHHYNSKSKLDVVVEEKALEDDSAIRLFNVFDDDDFHADSLSSSSAHSISSLHYMPTDGQTSSGDGSSSMGEAEVQSEYRRHSSSSLGVSSPKKGLSQFYAGKSRSFSCLRDVVSLKELAKPENPYAKKRKGNVARSLHGRPHLPPLQKGVASISKKLPYNGKSTLALAVVMSAKDDEMTVHVKRTSRNVQGLEGGREVRWPQDRTPFLICRELWADTFPLTELR